MATVTYTIANATATELNDALAYHFDYDNTKLEGETKAQFSKRMVIEHFLKEKIHSYRRAQKLAEVSSTDPDIT